MASAAVQTMPALLRRVPVAPRARVAAAPPPPLLSQFTPRPAALVPQGTLLRGGRRARARAALGTAATIVAATGESPAVVVIGDIGGTNCRLQLWQVRRGRWSPHGDRPRQAGALRCPLPAPLPPLYPPLCEGYSRGRAALQVRAAIGPPGHRAELPCTPPPPLLCHAHTLSWITRFFFDSGAHSSA